MPSPYRNVHYLYKVTCSSCSLSFVPPVMRKLGKPFQEEETDVCEDCYDLRMDQEYTNLLDFTAGVVECYE